MEEQLNYRTRPNGYFLYLELEQQCFVENKHQEMEKKKYSKKGRNGFSSKSVFEIKWYILKVYLCRRATILKVNSSIKTQVVRGFFIFKQNFVISKIICEKAQFSNHVFFYRLSSGIGTDVLMNVLEYCIIFHVWAA